MVFAKAAEPRLAEFDAKDLANMAWAFAGIAKVDEELFAPD